MPAPIPATALPQERPRLRDRATGETPATTETATASELSELGTGEFWQHSKKTLRDGGTVYMVRCCGDMLAWAAARSSFQGWGAPPPPAPPPLPPLPCSLILFSV